MEHNYQTFDRIYIRDLFLRCIIGIKPEERKKRQDLLINITLFADLSQACTSDQLEDTIDYKWVKNRIVEMVEHSSYFLVERLAEKIAEICLESPQVHHVRVLVEKPGALRFARSVGVEIVRTRDQEC
jgi:FolB domain-containing protein